MVECHKCKANAEHQCPVCKKFFCENHVVPFSHKCKVKINKKFNKLTLIPILIVVFILAHLLYTFLNSGIVVTFNDEPETEAPVLLTKQIFLNLTLHLSADDINQQRTFLAMIYKQPYGNGYYYYLIDDFDNKILLDYTKLSQKEQQSITRAQSNQVYEVTGFVRQSSVGRRFELVNITIADRPTVTIIVNDTG